MLPSPAPRFSRTFRSGKKTRLAAPRRRRLFLESLEERRVLANVAVFDNPLFVDTAGGTGAESDNIQASLISQGHTVTTFTGTSAAAISAALAGKQIVVIPEMENGDLNFALDAAGRAAFASFVSGGGSMLVHGSGGTLDEALLNAVFGFGIVGGGTYFSGQPFNLTASAAGTSYAGGPATLPGISGTFSHLKSSLPAATKSIYDNGTDSIVTLTPFGAGQIAFLGFDWFDAAPVGIQNGGWLPTLAATVTQLTTPTTSTVVAEANGPYTITEGQPLVLSSAGSTAPASAIYEWDVDGDGDYDENITGQNPTVSWAQLQALGIGDGHRAGNITLRINDSAGSGGSGATNELIVNGTFETGTLAGWTMSGVNGGWAINNGSFVPPGPAGAIAPIAGSFDAQSFQTGTGLNILSEPIVVPSGISNATLSWADRIRNTAGTFSDPNQEFRVNVLTAGGALIQNVFSTNPGDAATQLGPNNRSFDLTSLLQSLSGQTIRISFEQQDNLGFFNVNVDNVSLQVTTGGPLMGSSEYVVNGGFESGSVAGWTITNTGSSAWVINNGTFDPLSPSTPTSPLAGNFDAVADQSGPSMQMLSQPIVVPAGVTAATMSWLDRIQSHAPLNDPLQEFRVLVLDAGGGLIQEIFSTNPIDPAIQIGPNNRSFNVTSLMQSLAGQTIRLAFQVNSQSFYFTVNIDNISLQMSTGSSVAQTFYVSDVLNNSVVTINPVSGAQQNLTIGGNLSVPPGIDVEATGQLVVGSHDGPQNLVRVNPVSGAQTIVSAPIGATHSVNVHSNGQIYVGGHNVIVRIDPITGAQTPIPVPGTFVEDLDFEAAGTIVFSGSDSLLRRLDITTNTVTTVSSGFSSTFGVAVAGDGQIYVADGGFGRISRVDPVTGAQTIIASGGSLGPSVRDIDFDANGDLIVAATVNIVRVNVTTGAQTVISTGGLLAGAYGLAIAGASASGGSDTDTATFTITNANPTVNTFTVPAVAPVNAPVLLNAAATDPAAAADPLTFTWTITRPDTSTFVLTGASASFVPSQQGSYGVSLSVTDGDGGSDVETATIAVAGTVADIVSGHLIVRDELAGGKHDNLRVEFDAANDWFNITDPDNLLFIVPSAGTQVSSNHIRVPRTNFGGNVFVQTQDGNDLLTVDSSMTGSGRPVVYQGGAPVAGPPGDALAVSGPGAFTNITHTFFSSSDGNLFVDGYPIHYTGLEPVTDTLVAGNRTFTFTGGAETVTLTNSGGAADTMSTISSTLGESVAFANPTTSLTINLTGGSDTLLIQGLDTQESGPAPFSANLSINGDGNDTVNFLTSLIDLGSGFANIGTTPGQPISAIHFNGGGLRTTSGVFLSAVDTIATNSTLLDIVATELVASAGNGVTLDTSITYLEASGGNGGVDVANTKDLTVGGFNSVVGVSATGGNIALSSVGPLTVNEPVINTGGGLVDLDAVSGVGGGSGQVLLIEDQQGFGGAAGVLTGNGFSVAVVNNEFANGYANLLNGAFLSAFDFVVYGERGGGTGDALPAPVVASLEAYIQAGGDLLVTGYDTLGSPTDGLLAGLVRSLTPSDSVSNNANWQTPNLNHFVLNGPFGDFRGLAFSHIGYDDDILVPDVGAGAVELASIPGVTSRIIFTDLPGAAGSVGYWNGGLSGTATNAQPDFSSGGNPQGIFLNWAAGVVGGVGPAVDGEIIVNADVGGVQHVTIDAETDITLNGSVTISSADGSVTLRAGDDLTTSPASIVQAAAQVFVQADFGADPDPGVGSTVNLGGTITSDSNVEIQLGNDADNVTLAGVITSGTVGIAGGIRIELASGNDVLTANGPVDATLTALFSSVRISGQNGSDTFHIGDAINGSATINSPITIIQGLDFPGAEGDPNELGDIFNVRISTTTAFELEGDNPAVAPGDVLNIDLTGVAGPATEIHGIPDTTITAPGFLPITYREMETSNAIAGLVNHVFDLDNFPTGNVLDVQLTDQNTLQVALDGAVVFSGGDDNVNSLTFAGRAGTNDSLRIHGLVTGELVGEAGALVGVGSLPEIDGLRKGITTSFTDSGRTLPGGNSPPAIYFDGRGGIDSIVLDLPTARDVAYFSDGGVIGAGDLSVQASGSLTGLAATFSNLESVHLLNRNGIGSSLVVDATSSADTENITVADIADPVAPLFSALNPVNNTAALGGAAGFTLTGASQITGDGGLLTTTFGGFQTVAVRGGVGAETIHGLSVDGGPSLGGGALTSLTLDGGSTRNLADAEVVADIAADTIRLHSVPSTVATLLTGRGGNDLLQMFDSALTVDNIAGPVVIDGGDGNVAGNTDTLEIRDSGDGSGDTVLISAVNPLLSADFGVEGLTPAVGSDVIFRNIDALEYTATSGDDIIDVRFVNTVPLHDLTTVSVRGWLGADQFLLFTSDQIGGSGLGLTPSGMASGVASVQLFGDAPGNPNIADGLDTFGATPPGISGTGIMNVGQVVSDAVRLIRPSVTTSIAIDGGRPSNPLAAPLGDILGDTANVDISALPNAAPVVVSTFAPGTVVAAGIQPLTWTEIEDLNVVDQGELANVQMGDLFARTTPQIDLVQLTQNPTTLNPNRVRLRITASVANYSASNKTIIYGGEGNDFITQANLTIPAEFYGELGDDYLSGAMNNDWLVGGQGNDRLNGSGGDNVLWGDDSPTLPTDPQPQDLLVGGDDVLSALSGSDVFYGGGGHDVVSGGGGNDYAYGGQGNDTLDGNDGDDRLYGGLGEDTINGHAGNDLLSGGEANDLLFGSDGHDVLFGGDGTDAIDGGSGNDLLVSGSVENENSSWTSLPSVANYSAATYTSLTDFDAALLTLLTQWANFGNRSSIGAITHDLVDDNLTGGLGDDDFSWESLDVLDNPPGANPSDFNAVGFGADERFGPF